MIPARGVSIMHCFDKIIEERFLNAFKCPGVKRFPFNIVGSESCAYTYNIFPRVVHSKMFLCLPVLIYSILLGWVSGQQTRNRDKQLSTFPNSTFPISHELPRCGKAVGRVLNVTVHAASWLPSSPWIFIIPCSLDQTKHRCNIRPQS